MIQGDMKTNTMLSEDATLTVQNWSKEMGSSSSKISKISSPERLKTDMTSTSMGWY